MSVGDIPAEITTHHEVGAPSSNGTSLPHPMRCLQALSNLNPHGHEGVRNALWLLDRLIVFGSEVARLHGQPVTPSVPVLHRMTGLRRCTFLRCRACLEHAGLLVLQRGTCAKRLCSYVVQYDVLYQSIQQTSLRDRLVYALHQYWSTGQTQTSLPGRLQSSFRILPDPPDPESIRIDARATRSQIFSEDPRPEPEPEDRGDELVQPIVSAPPTVPTGPATLADPACIWYDVTTAAEAASSSASARAAGDTGRATRGGGPRVKTPVEAVGSSSDGPAAYDGGLANRSRHQDMSGGATPFTRPAHTDPAPLSPPIPQGPGNRVMERVYRHLWRRTGRGGQYPEHVVPDDWALLLDLAEQVEEIVTGRAYQSQGPASAEAEDGIAQDMCVALDVRLAQAQNGIGCLRACEWQLRQVIARHASSSSIASAQAPLLAPPWTGEDRGEGVREVGNPVPLRRQRGEMPSPPAEVEEVPESVAPEHLSHGARLLIEADAGPRKIMAYLSEGEITEAEAKYLMHLSRHGEHQAELLTQLRARGLVSGNGNGIEDYEGKSEEELAKLLAMYDADVAIIAAQKRVSRAELVALLRSAQAVGDRKGTDNAAHV